MQLIFLIQKTLKSTWKDLKLRHFGENFNKK